VEAAEQELLEAAQVRAVTAVQVVVVQALGHQPTLVVVEQAHLVRAMAAGTEKVLPINPLVAEAEQVLLGFMALLLMVVTAVLVLHLQLAEQ
jgi:hypothetical protein